jgi:hypothetical protein
VGGNRGCHPEEREERGRRFSPQARPNGSRVMPAVENLVQVI